jgi:two-component system, cell cycle response regulator
MKEPAFLDEARTMEVFIRTADIGGPAASPAAVDRALLLRMDGIHAGSVIAIERLPFTIGRHPTNVLRIDEESISRHHARITREGDSYVLEDLGSRNGSFVAGSRVTRQAIEDGTSLALGAHVTFRFQLTDTRQERLLRRLYESSTRDALTGAYNRSHFDERLRSELAFAGRHRTETSLVLLDIDHFKRVNDTYGHQAGDVVLRELAVLAQRSLRTEDVFARFGGEEFGVILRGIHLLGAQKLGERLRVALESSPIQAGEKSIRVTLSAGCASIACVTNPTPEEIVKIADRRLYAAKGAGRNRVVASG